MRRLLKTLAWGLATAALIVATPLRAIASVPVTTPLAPTVTAVAVVPTPPAAAANEVGGGWNELYCAACVGTAAYALFTGGTVMLPLFLANPEVVGTMTATCIYSCRTVIEGMLK